MIKGWAVIGNGGFYSSKYCSRKLHGFSVFSTQSAAEFFLSKQPNGIDDALRIVKIKFEFVEDAEER